MSEEIKQVIKFDAERNRDFAEDIMKDEGCENLRHCIQCGTCSAYCPFSAFMDFTPRRLIALTRAGFKNEVLSSRTIWLCTACYGCTAECPKEIRITDIMYALKRRALKSGLYPKKFPVPVMIKDFYDMAGAEGRISENRLATSMLLKTDWRKMFGMWKLGYGLMRTGRFTMKTEHIEQKPQLTQLLNAMESRRKEAHPQ